uniref:Uncharacterized protein n=1 Tax=Panagrolaimus superbus TaxID=310955 RepID=A0A914Z3S0_9BILA
MSLVEKGFVLSPTEMLYVSFNHEAKDVQQQIAFKKTYELAKKQALKIQELFPEENFNLVDSIKGYLIDVIPHAEFSRMPKSFITDFVVANGIISEEQANHIFDIRVKIKNYGKIVNGIIKEDDDIGIRGAIEKMKFCKMTRQSTTKIRFLKLKFTIPLTPSFVQKMKGCEWYLCLESDGILTFKHHSIVQISDYLLAEMKSNAKFQLTPGKTTFLFARFNNVS